MKKLMNRLEDLRFVIGLFFGIVSIILLVTSLFVGSTPEASDSGNLNLFTGIVMFVFSVFMLGSAILD